LVDASCQTSQQSFQTNANCIDSKETPWLEEDSRW
jgi:hypothetical protein